MITSIIPTAVFATDYIREVYVTNVLEPIAGIKWESQWDKSEMTYDNSSYAVFQQPEWYDETEKRFMTPNEVFKVDHIYTVQVWVEANDGYEFDSTVTSYNMKGYINEKEAKLSKAYEYQRWAMVVVSYTFPQVKNNKKITNVSVTDIVEPKIGKQSIARPHYLKYSEGVEGYRASWYENYHAGAEKFTGVFAEEKTYTFEVIMKAKEGYEFARKGTEADVTVTFNGIATDVVAFDGAGRLCVRFEYENLGVAKEKVMGAITYKIKEPVIGENPSYEAENQRDDNLYVIDTKHSGTVNGIVWEEGISDNSRVMNPEDTFKAGEYYHVTIWVKPAEGYLFEKDRNDDFMMVGAINSEYAICGGNDESAFVGYTFDKLEEEKRTIISEIEATSNYPAICYMYGKNYSPRFTITKGSPATIHFTDWEVKYGNKDWEKLASNENFSGGLARISAQIRIDGEAAKKYVLSNDTKVKVNGKEWTVSSVRVEDGYSYGHIQSPQIVPVPVEEAPTFTVTFDSKGGSKVEPVTGSYYAYGVAEFDDPVRSGYKFDGWYKDEQYSEKFIFINNTNDVMGGYDRVYEDITLYAKWEKSSKEEQEAPSQTEKPTEIDAPQETPKSTFTDVEKSQYYYDAVMWAAENGITGGTSETTFSPDAICTRAQVVTFLHRMVASPEPAAIDMPFVDVKEEAFYYKPVKWAVGSKITGGTSATTFSPDANCTRAQVVTFLWRTAGQPKPSGKSNPFTDVQADSYYYDAVLWAVENSITGGTSATTFSPDNNCTRAQVVTFLYRFINAG
ncbi:MAG: S-layer homology domain-containing protein [Clostridia bacterium]|nr:S-layer homology domain-containing protein [Clostridia bacterium]